jgi:hypothetical protein
MHAHTGCGVTDQPQETGDTTMLKTALALAIALATASSAFAVSKKYSNPAHDVFVNGKYVGSDPDPTIRSTLARDPTGTD